MMRHAFLLLLLAPLCSAATCDFAGGVFADAVPIIAAAILFSVALAAIAYMVGSMLGDARLKVGSRDLLFQAFISVLLVLSIQGIFTGMCLMTSDFLGGEDALSIAISDLRQLRIEGAQILTELMKKVVSEKFEAAYFAGYYIPFSGGETFFPYGEHNAYARHAEIVFDMAMLGYVSVGIQSMILKGIRDLTLAILLPFGLVLRSLPKLREGGNVLLALALALYVVLPFAYAVNSTAAEIMPDFCDGNDRVFGACDDGYGFGTVALYLFRTIFLPNLALVIFATSAGALMKVAKVIP